MTDQFELTTHARNITGSSRYKRSTSDSSVRLDKLPVTPKNTIVTYQLSVSATVGQRRCPSKNIVMTAVDLMENAILLVSLEADHQSLHAVNQCWVLVRVKSPSLVMSLLLVAQSGSNGTVVLDDRSGNRYEWNSGTRRIPPGTDMVSVGQEVYFRVMVHGEGLHSSQLNIQAVVPSARHQLQLRYLTSAWGYIQVPGMRVDLTQLTSYRDNMDAWTDLAVPEDIQVMLSVALSGLGVTTWNHVCDDHLEVFTGSRNDSLWKVCYNNQTSQPPVVRDVRQVWVHFRSGSSRFQKEIADVLVKRGIGFRLIFSFHEFSAIPEQIPGSNRWNCSVHHWPDFQPHFLCNLVRECGEGEDEASCPYTLCADHSVHHQGKCVSLHRPSTALSWRQANARCTKLGGHLAVPSTFSNWNFWRSVMRLDIAIMTGYDIYIGVHGADTDLLAYKDILQWTDTTVAYYTFISLHDNVSNQRYGCLSIYSNHGHFNIRLHSAFTLENRCGLFSCYYMCDSDHNITKGNPVRLPYPKVRTPRFSHVWCPSGHSVHTFLALDQHSHCCADQQDGPGFSSGSNGSSSVRDCGEEWASFPHPLVCDKGQEVVPYTLVCDRRADCMDGSDEAFCHYIPCDAKTQWQCTDGGCIPIEGRCNRSPECIDRSDEDACVIFSFRYFSTPPPHIIVVKARANFIDIDRSKLASLSYCRETHFMCPPAGDCLPVHVRCNQINDCPGKEDEADCERYTCPGFYRCWKSKMCVHVFDLCDTFPHCPLHDDEQFCHLTCPPGCTCYGFSFVCSRPVELDNYSKELRYLNGAKSGMTLLDVRNNTMLIHISLLHCHVYTVHNVTLPNLRSLDLSNNKIREVEFNSFVYMTNLQTLNLAKNPITYLSGSDFIELPLKHLDLSEILTREISLDVLAMTDLHTFNISKSHVKSIARTGPKGLSSLRVFDSRGCPLVSFPKTLLLNSKHLQAVYADNYKLCCSAMLPDGFNVYNCHAPFNEISSCDALLRSPVYRISLSVFVFLALVGNVVSFSLRVVVKRRKSWTGFDVFVANLCVADFLMGVYLAVIGVADHVYKNSYLWEELQWRHSGVCRFAGFVSLLSSEVSAFVICVITLERFLVIQFPFSQLRFKPSSAKCLCGVCWITGCLVGSLPLLPVASTWQFYSQTGICIPLPVTRHHFEGQYYAFAVMIVLNFILFLFIALGQMCIYWSVQLSKMKSTGTTKKLQDARLARRLMTVVMSDFLCWFPVGLLGLLAQSDVPIPSEVNVAIAIFVLPLNSALNPFLYTLNMLQEKRQQSKENKLLKQLMAHEASQE